MPLANYGVAIGTFQSFSRDPSHEYGHWYHGHLFVNTPSGTDEAALDVDAPASVGVSYRLVTDLTVADIATVQALPDGFHPLAATPLSGALDYVRSPLLVNRLERAARWATTNAFRLACKPAPGEPVFGPDLADQLSDGLHWLGRHLPEGPVRPSHRLRFRWFPWHPSDGDNALDALEPHLAAATRIYLFGQRFTTGHGVHDVHLNQGDPAGSQWYAENGIWQDGAVMCENSDGTVILWQIKFNTQSLDTDSQGHPN
ncbi:MAG: hypothetical protein QOE61_3479 [Micromonosporaceae bacterium]|jgi:hypothetical protein|nr:hypothetical protein [Micromonosporaceae bacterium]